MDKIDSKKYIIVLFITIFLFMGAISLSGFLNNKKIDQVKSIQDKISIDILSSETQFSLLSELSCQDVSRSNLSSELNSLAEKITFSEENIGNTNDDVIELKKFYSLLEIKDFLLMKKINERCKTKTYSILYFYTTANNCSECIKQGYVLTSLREKYPDLRVYSFDYNLDLSALRAMISIYKIEDTKLPAIVVSDKLTTGFQSLEDVEKLLPNMVKEYQKAEEEKLKAEEEAKKQ